MAPDKPKITTLLMWALLAVLVIACVFLAPQTLNAYQRMETELNATPTPTADNASMLAVTLDPNSTPAPTAVLLKIGTRGDAVNKLQQRLKDLGYYTGDVDGQYGQGTAQAVMLFQNQHGIDGDGLAGEKTLELVYAAGAETYVPTPTPSATPSAYVMGDYSDGVKELQRRLKELGYLAGNVDGDFGAGTKTAVELFQKQNGLEVNGIADQKTIGLLFSDSAKKAPATPIPSPSATPESAHGA